MTSSTVLSISGISISDYSTRGLTQTLQPIQQAAVIRRTVNGTARNVAGTQFHKYTTKISCHDQEGPGFTGTWPGATITITCLPDLGGGSDQVSPLVLTCMVETWDVSKDEAGNIVGWDLSATEI